MPHGCGDGGGHGGMAWGQRMIRWWRDVVGESGTRGVGRGKMESNSNFLGRSVEWAMIQAVESDENVVFNWNKSKLPPPPSTLPKV